MLTSDYLALKVYGQMDFGDLFQLVSIGFIIIAIVYVVKKRDFDED